MPYLGRAAEPATVDGTIAKRAARELVEVGGARPADIPAAGTLAGLETAMAASVDLATLATAKAFD